MAVPKKWYDLQRYVETKQIITRNNPHFWINVALEIKTNEGDTD